MKLCAVVENGKIKFAVLVEDNHVFGDRRGYAHVLVEFISSIPEEYNGERVKLSTYDGINEV